MNLIVWKPIDFLLSPLLLAYSRKNEREADDAVLQFPDKRIPFKKALIKLHKENFSNINPHPLYVIFNYSHPPVIERLKRIK